MDLRCVPHAAALGRARLGTKYMYISVSYIFSLWTAFAAGYALAKAVLEFERARWGVKRRASRIGEADFTC